MPSYRNNTAAPITPIGGKTYAPGEERNERKYLVGANGLTITSHIVAPWKTLVSSSLPISLTALAQYKQIVIVNDTTAVVSVVANTDASNPLAVAVGGMWPIEQDREIDVMAITGSGTGSVTVYGLR